MSSVITADDILPSRDAEQLIDFTCESPWERFALDIELIFRAWQISDASFPHNFPPLSPETARYRSQIPGLESTPTAARSISLANRAFWLELRDEPEDRTLDAAPLQRLLGVNRCVLLLAEFGDGTVAEDGTDATSLLSAMTVAASACGCTLPLIVPVGRPSSFRFIGRQVGVRMARFCCDFLNYLPDDYAHLAGLLRLFCSKRSAARRTIPPRAKEAVISAKFIYDWSDFSFKISPPPHSFAADRRLAAVQEEALTEYDPVRRIRLSSLWDVFSAGELNPDRAAMLASSASRMRLSPSPDLVKTLSTQHIPTGRIPLTSSVRACLRLAVKAARGSNFIAAAAPVPLLDTKRALAEAKYIPSIVSIEDDTKAGLRGEGGGAERGRASGSARVPLPSALEDFLTQAKHFLSAAAMDDKGLDDEYLSSAIAALFDSSTRGVMGDVVEALGPILAELSLTERLGKLMGSLNSMNAVKYLWSLFLDGVEIHWEQRWMIAGVHFQPGQGPNLYENLIVQKLQMMNCCVDREHLRKTEAEQKADDNFGRKQKLENVGLIDIRNGTDGANAEVWEPYVQPIPLVTRDIVEAEQNRLVTGADVNHRNRGESKTLTSDMMAFKAANPTASMADFVRWFSPSDWVASEDDQEEEKEDVEMTAEQDGNAQIDSREASDAAGGAGTNSPTLCRAGSKKRGSGRLSARMQNPGNEWAELWATAVPLPAHRQQGLFDTEAHGRQALTDLRNMPMAQVLLQLGVVLGSSATQLLHDAFAKPPAQTHVRSDIERAKSAFRDANATVALHIAGAKADSATKALELDANKVAEAANALAHAEHMALCATSLLMKLPPTETFAKATDELAHGGEFTVVEDRDRELLARMAGLDDGHWRPLLLPEYREFLLEGSGDGGRAADRMYARLSSDEFRTAFQLGLEYEM